MAAESHNEGFHVLDEFVCEAIHAPAVPLASPGNQGRNAGMSVIEELDVSPVLAAQPPNATRFDINKSTTFTFNDATSGEAVCVIVRCAEDSVALAISLSSNRDAQVVLHREELSKLIVALTDARDKI